MRWLPWMPHSGSLPQAMLERWIPDERTLAAANVTSAMAETGFADFGAFHHWTCTERSAFWAFAIERLGIVFQVPYEAIRASAHPEHPGWLPGARLNIVESCFRHEPDSPALTFARDGTVHTMSRLQLLTEVQRAAGGLRAMGVEAGVSVAIAMPMTVEAVIAYLAIIWLGGAVVSIADSFAPEEIAARIRIGGASFVVTQEHMDRAGKRLPMYAKIAEAKGPASIVVQVDGDVELRTGDVWWHDMVDGGDPIDHPVVRDPDEAINVLFSSGTTGDPKAIPWTQATPIKAAVDGHFHQDIHAADVVAWPTNLGWMMGPWLIFASLINGASLALYDDVPTERGFLEFVEQVGVTVLGTVPSLVAAWRAGGVTEGLDLTGIRLFSSTGEASDAADMAWLMAEAGGRPVIEYCGGTEIGGGYITATVVHDVIPGTFSTPAVGIDLRILDEAGVPSELGEVFLVPPSIGLSETLLNRDHHEVYFAGLPHADVPLRRHGDQMERLPNGYFRALGRVDDTMNLGGIKVSSAEIERVVAVPGVVECAAVAVPPPEGGPDRLVIYVVEEATADRDEMRGAMQAAIKSRLNPLFKIHEVVVVPALPRTASAKIMRRALRASYGTGSDGDVADRW